MAKPTADEKAMEEVREKIDEVTNPSAMSLEEYDDFLRLLRDEVNERMALRKAERKEAGET